MRRSFIDNLQQIVAESIGEHGSGMLNFQLVVPTDLEPPGGISAPVAAALTDAVQEFLARLHTGTPGCATCLLCDGALQTAERPDACPTALVLAVFADVPQPNRVLFSPVCSQCACNAEPAELQQQVMDAYCRAIPGLEVLPQPGHA